MALGDGSTTPKGQTIFIFLFFLDLALGGGRFSHPKSVVFGHPQTPTGVVWPPFIFLSIYILFF
jgi:hypothetical protein